MALNPMNPDELAVGTRDGTVTVWDVKTKKARLTLRLGKFDITALAFSPTNNLLAVGADGYKVFIYNARTGQLFGQSFREHDSAVTALMFTPDGNKLLSASTDSTIVIHDMDPVNWAVHACQIANRNLTHAEWKQYIGDALPYHAVCEDLPLEPEDAITAMETP
jgi:WD40 repeat protein